jgi:hypothetical protein
MNNIKRIEQKFNALPPDLLNELESYLDFLLQKIKTSEKGEFKQNWAGSMKKFRKKYTSIELQKKSLEWRSNDVIG